MQHKTSGGSLCGKDIFYLKSVPAGSVDVRYDHTARSEQGTNAAGLYTDVCPGVGFTKPPLERTSFSKGRCFLPLGRSP